MLQLLKEDLVSSGAFSGTLPPIVKQVVESIHNPLIPYRMKLTIAASELVFFTSNLRRNIKHWNGSMIPINAISFTISKSGSGKDSARNAALKCFKDGYTIIEEKRKSIATQNAIKQATLAGKPDPQEYNTYREFYVPPNPLFVAPSTSEGFIQHLNDLDHAGIGAGFIYAGEVGSEMSTSSVFIDNIKLLAELYDEGSKEVKVLKSRENQSKEIKNLPVGALFVGSQDNILYDPSVNKTFTREFSTKLARRSFFNYSPETITPIQYESVAAMLEAETLAENNARNAMLTASATIKDIATKSIKGAGQPIDVSPEVRELFIKYKRYNEELAETLPGHLKLSRLVRTHQQWKALKFSGALAILNNHSSILLEDYISAISYCEMLDQDMQAFEAELVKEPYEHFVDFMHTKAENNKAFIGIHELRKRQYIPTTGSHTVKMKELIQLATSYDKTGIYTVCDEGICYESIQLTNVSGVSFVECSGTKEHRMQRCSIGYKFYETTFSELADMLHEDLAYSPFHFKDGKRGKDYIIGGCKWIYLDIDDSTITDEECHFILQDVNHHIARTSDNTNPFKFRILLELDALVDLTDKQWVPFVRSISESLSLTSDPLPRSQIAFSYSGREVLSVVDASPIEVKEHLLVATSTEERPTPPKPTTAQAKALLADEFNTFEFAFNATPGNRYRSLIRAALLSHDLNNTKEATVELVHSINNFWEESCSNKALLSVLQSISRW